MNALGDAFKELDAEKSLWQIYRASAQIRPSRFNIFAPLVFFFFISIASFALFEDQSKIISLARELARIALSSAISLLGFFVTGFAIFATLADKDLLCEMAVRQHDKYNLSYFKYNFFVFIRVFSTTIFVCFLLLLFIVLMGPGTGIGLLLMRLIGPNVKAVLAIVLGLTAALMLVLLVVAKSFVANIYLTVVASTQWAMIKKCMPSETAPMGSDKGEIQQ